MNILFVNQSFAPDTAATAQHLMDIAEDCVRGGHRVTVLTSQRSYNDPRIHYPRQETINGIQVRRVPGSALGRHSQKRRMLDAAWTNIGFAWALLRIRRHDVVVAMTSPPLIGFVAALTTWGRGERFVYWVMDINPDQVIRIGWIRDGSVFATLLQLALRTAVRMSDAVITLDSFMKERLLSYGSSPERTFVIPPWAHSSDVRRVERSENSFPRRYGLEGKWIVMYAGNLSVCHPIKTLLDAALALRSSPDITFVFIGGGGRVNEVREFQQAHQLENIRILPYLPRSEIAESLSAAHLHVITMGEPFVGIVHPSKIYNILYLGMPFLFIGPQNSALGHLIRDEGIGSIATHGDVNRVISLIQDARQLSSEEGRVLTERIRNIGQRFSREKGSGAFQAILANMAERPDNRSRLAQSSEEHQKII